MDAPRILKDSPHWTLRKGLEPVSISGNAIRWDNPNTWMSYEEVAAAYEQAKERFDGIGYIIMDDEIPIKQSEPIITEDRDLREKVEEIILADDSSKTEGRVTEKNDIIGINLDYCRDPISGEVSSWAKCILHRLNSPSSINIAGTGFIAFCTCSHPFDFKNIPVFSADDLSEVAQDQFNELRA